MTEDQPRHSEFKSRSGLQRILAAALYSIDGFRAAWRHEYAFRQELLVAIPGAIIALLLPISPLRSLLLVAVLLLSGSGRIYSRRW